MSHIKIVGLFISLFSIILVFIFSLSNTQGEEDIFFTHKLDTKRAFTQEISKQIFYIYRQKDSSSDTISKIIRSFSKNNNVIWEHHNDEGQSIKEQREKIDKLWNGFYKLVHDFREQNIDHSPYSKIILQKTVKSIYDTNIELIKAFNELQLLHDNLTKERKNRYSLIQYLLFLALAGLLLFLFTQLRVLLLFMQDFIKISKNIIDKSSFKVAKPIVSSSANQEALSASNNFNLLLKQIDNNIESATLSLDESTNSLDKVDEHIEDFMSFIDSMKSQEESSVNFEKREDIVIQLLEELNSSSQNLKRLKGALETLISKE